MSDPKMNAIKTLLLAGMIGQPVTTELLRAIRSPSPRRHNDSPPVERTPVPDWSTHTRQQRRYEERKAKKGKQ